MLLSASRIEKNYCKCSITPESNHFFNDVLLASVNKDTLSIIVFFGPSQNRNGQPLSYANVLTTIFTVSTKFFFEGNKIGISDSEPFKYVGQILFAILLVQAKLLAH